MANQDMTVVLPEAPDLEMDGAFVVKRAIAQGDTLRVRIKTLGTRVSLHIFREGILGIKDTTSLFEQNGSGNQKHSGAVVEAMEFIIQNTEYAAKREQKQ